jgi:membrane-bound metal-dependent hydrolase YbcI (DUF457 family)
MVYAFGHLIGGWLFGKVIEGVKRIKLSQFAWIVLFFGAILPDADFLVDWTLGADVHRTFTHSLLFLIMVPLLFYIVLTVLKRKDNSILTLALGTGIFTHLLLDMPMGHGVPLLWPSLLHFSFTSIAYYDPTSFSFAIASEAHLWKSLKFAIFDMGLGTCWIFYLLFRKHLRP